MPGTLRDMSGSPLPLEDGTPADTLGAFGSAIAWSGVDDRYVAAVDRGPSDGATSFADRMQWLDVRVDPRAPGGVTVNLVATTLLVDERGRQLVGKSDAFDADMPERGSRFDPEGVRVSRTGSLFVSDEYGPWVVEFSRAGRLLRRLPVPEHYRIRHPGTTKEEAIAGNDVGRVTNHGFEGLAVHPDGTALFALLQHSLIQDGGREGRNVRLLEIPLDGGATREYVVVLDDAEYVFNELVAIGARRFLAIERDRKGGAKARVKHVVLVDLEGATDVSRFESLPKDGLPQDVSPARKEVVLDLLARAHGLAGPEFPEKVEGLCFGPDLPDGRRRLIVTSDNDMDRDRPSHLWVFAVPDEAIGGFVPQSFDATR